MFIPPYAELNRVLVPLAIETGRIVFEFYNTDFKVQHKNDKSPVTDADHAAEAYILDGLNKHWPQITVVAEEMCAGGIIPAATDLFFLVDPLDGTKEFINKRDEFTVNIGLIVNGAPYYGVVFAPALGDLYVSLSGAKAGHAFIEPANLVDGSAETDFDKTDFQEITTRDWGSAELGAVVSRSHMDEKTAEFLRNNNISDEISSGSSLKFCKIAAGAADIYPRFGPTMEWDTAAGHGVVCAAGGIVVDGSGQPFRYGKDEAGYLNGDFVACAKSALKNIKFQ